MVKTSRYKIAFSEVYEILQYLDKDEYKKIPQELIETIKNNRDKDYLYNIDSEKKLKEQKMLPETKAILFNIFRDYLCTEAQKETIKNWQIDDLNKIEKEKKLKYDVDLFKDNRNNHNDLSVTNNTQLIEVKEKSIWKKFFNKIKAIFHK